MAKIPPALKGWTIDRRPSNVDSNSTDTVRRRRCHVASHPFQFPLNLRRLLLAGNSCRGLYGFPDTPPSQHAPSRLLLLPRRHKNGNVEKVVVVIKKPSNTKLVSREQGRPFFSWRRLHYIRFPPPNNPPPSQCDPKSPSTVWHALGHALLRSRVYQSAVWPPPRCPLIPTC